MRAKRAKLLKRVIHSKKLPESVQKSTLLKGLDHRNWLICHLRSPSLMPVMIKQSWRYNFVHLASIPVICQFSLLTVINDVGTQWFNNIFTSIELGSRFRHPVLAAERPHPKSLCRRETGRPGGLARRWLTFNTNQIQIPTGRSLG